MKISQNFAIATVFAASLMASGTAFAEGVTLWSDTPVDGATYDFDAGKYSKTIDVDPDVAANMSKWKVIVETRSTGGDGFMRDKDTRNFTKTTVRPYDKATDGPNFCTHVQWSETQKDGFTWDHDARSYYKVAILTLADAQKKGLR